MRHPFKYICILAATVVTLAGCRSHKELQRTDEGKTDSTAVAKRPKPPLKPAASNLERMLGTEYDSYRANFSCTVNGITVNGQIRIAKDSIVWVSVNKIIEMGRAKLTPTRAQAYARLAGKQYDGDYEGLKKRWGIDADYATIEALLTGNCPPDCDRTQEPKRNGDTVTHKFSQRNGQRQLTVRKSYTTLLPTEIEMYSPSTGQRLHIVYGPRQQVDGRMLPTSIGIRINSSQINEQTVVKLEKIKVDEEQSYPFK